MADIKSTLDLVMEKTKHLSLSGEEKQKQKTIEIEKRINGLLHEYQDQALPKDRLLMEFDKLKADFSLPDNASFVNQILSGLSLDKDNHLLLALLKEFCDADLAGIASMLDEFEDEVNSAASYRMVELREELAQKHLISGSAVVPNLQADDTWQAEAGAIRSKFEKKLEEEKGRIECT
jgi:hypothetical protein